MINKEFIPKSNIIELLYQRVNELEEKKKEKQPSNGVHAYVAMEAQSYNEMRMRVRMQVYVMPANISKSVDLYGVSFNLDEQTEESLNEYFDTALSFIEKSYKEVEILRIDKIMKELQEQKEALEKE